MDPLNNTAFWMQNRKLAFFIWKLQTKQRLVTGWLHCPLFIWPCTKRLSRCGLSAIVSNGWLIRWLHSPSQAFKVPQARDFPQKHPTFAMCDAAIPSYIIRFITARVARSASIVENAHAFIPHADWSKFILLQTSRKSLWPHFSFSNLDPPPDHSRPALDLYDGTDISLLF